MSNIEKLSEMSAETLTLKTDLALIHQEYGSITAFQEKMAIACAKYKLQGHIIAHHDDYHLVVRFRKEPSFPSAGFSNR